MNPWIVLKFGGTSVSTVANWQNIAKVAKTRADEGFRVLLVHSALSGVTDLLEGVLRGALQGDAAPALVKIRDKHQALASVMNVSFPMALEAHLADLEKIASGIALVGEVSDRVRARALAAGELMATELGALFLRTQGLDVTWVDARTVLRSSERPGATEQQNTLSATCDFAPSERVQHALNTGTRFVLTQGFIAGAPEGHTVLLGRGGSDTSGAYFAGLLAASRLEIWTDVPGMFSANPKDVPTARLLRDLHYDEAQEIASSGAKVLHPRCILPARQQRIPIYVYDTQNPDTEGTKISGQPLDTEARVKAIAFKKGVTLISMESPGMWHQVGFLSDAFQVFKAHGLSVDLISTSETNVTVSLDPAANTLTPETLSDLTSSLSKLCKTEVLGPCASLSLVGKNIRGILHKIGDALELFEEHKIYLVSQAANDLSFTLVLDELQGERMVAQLHDLLVRARENDPVMGPTWEHLRASSKRVAQRPPWWHAKAETLRELLKERDAAYVYSLGIVREHARALTKLTSVDRVFYAMKANGNADVLRALVAEGVGIECVSPGEVEHALASCPGLGLERIMFTPNFAAKSEYAWALGKGVRTTVDNAFVLRTWGALFKDREIFLRVDTGVGQGHHAKVRTAGAYSKFGIPLSEIDEVARACKEHGARVVGLHAHSGSGILDAASWAAVAKTLLEVRKRFPDVRVLDLGGGLGVPERPDGPALDLAAMDASLAAQKPAGVEFWIEPGRFLVATAGVLLAKVTQLKGKGDLHYAGIATGMNSLIRPALYGAYHPIFNLSAVDAPPTRSYTIVGPICESGDQLGQDRMLPELREGDVLLIGNAGAYGYAMSSFYNRRAAAEEIALD
jgi:bifunctional diaminopimelate decarboxylase / aspartate kinase